MHVALGRRGTVLAKRGASSRTPNLQVLQVHLAVAAVLVSALSGIITSPARAESAPRSTIHGAITLLPPGANWMVVCATHAPFTCRKISSYGGTRVLAGSTSRSAHLALGEVVTVDARGQSDKLFAVTVRVTPDQMLRSIPNFKRTNAAHVQSALMRLPHVRAAQVIPDLGEVVVTFDSARTNPSVIEKAAAHGGVHLALPGA